MENKGLALELLEGCFGVCRLKENEDIPNWCFNGGLYSITKTHDELSIVCSEDYIPQDTKCEKGWRIIKILGPLDFSLIGILSSISSVLAREGISIFALPTYDTDYILIKDDKIKMQ